MSVVLDLPFVYSASRIPPRHRLEHRSRIVDTAPVLVPVLDGEEAPIVARLNFREGDALEYRWIGGGLGRSYTSGFASPRGSKHNVVRGETNTIQNVMQAVRTIMAEPKSFRVPWHPDEIGGAQRATFEGRFTGDDREA